MTSLKKNKYTRSGGFTLIEIVVAAGIFAVLLLIIVGVFSRFIFVQRRDIAEQQLQEDVRFALEYFNREARTSYGSTFTTSGSSTQIYFANQNKTCVTYRWQAQNQSLQRATSANAGPNCGAATYASFEPIISSDVNIIKLLFTVRPSAVAGTNLTNQAFITITLEAHAQGKEDKVVSLQSTVASRQLLPFTP